MSSTQYNGIVSQPKEKFQEKKIHSMLDVIVSNFQNKGTNKQIKRNRRRFDDEKLNDILTHAQISVNV